MTSLKNFEPGEAWLILPMGISVSGQVGELYCLLDVSSYFIFGHLVIVANMPSLKDLDALMMSAYKTKNMWPQKVFVSKKDRSADFFKIYAATKDLSLEVVSLSKFAALVKHVKKSFGIR